MESYQNEYHNLYDEISFLDFLAIEGIPHNFKKSVSVEGINIFHINELIGRIIYSEWDFGNIYKINDIEFSRKIKESVKMIFALKSLTKTTNQICTKETIIGILFLIPTFKRKWKNANTQYLPFVTLEGELSMNIINPPLPSTINCASSKSKLKSEIEKIFDDINKTHSYYTGTTRIDLMEHGISLLVGQYSKTVYQRNGKVNTPIIIFTCDPSLITNGVEELSKQTSGSSFIHFRKDTGYYERNTELRGNEFFSSSEKIFFDDNSENNRTHHSHLILVKKHIFGISPMKNNLRPLDTLLLYYQIYGNYGPNVVKTIIKRVSAYFRIYHYLSRNTMVTASTLNGEDLTSKNDISTFISVYQQKNTPAPGKKAYGLQPIVCDSCTIYTTPFNFYTTPKKSIVSDNE
jgi:hypothetical protein